MLSAPAYLPSAHHDDQRNLGKLHKVLYNLSSGSSDMST